MAAPACAAATPHRLHLLLADLDAAYSAAVVDHDARQRHAAVLAARLQYLDNLLQFVSPALAETAKAIQGVQREHLEEIRNLRSPPAAVQQTLNLVHALLRCKPFAPAAPAAPDPARLPPPASKAGVGVGRTRLSQPPQRPQLALRLRSAVVCGPGGAPGSSLAGMIGNGSQEDEATEEVWRPHSWPELRRILAMSLVADVLKFETQWLADRRDVIESLLVTYLHLPPGTQPADLQPVLEDGAALQRHTERRREQRTRQPSRERRSSDGLPPSSTGPTTLPTLPGHSQGATPALTFATVHYANRTCGLLFKWAVSQLQLALLLVAHGPVLQERAAIEEELRALGERDAEHPQGLGELRRRQVAVRQELERLLLEQAEAEARAFLRSMRTVAADELRGRAALQREHSQYTADLRRLLREAFPRPQLEHINERLEFAVGQAELTGPHLELLHRLAPRLLAFPEAVVAVQGHFSWNEAPAVAQRRAEAVLQCLRRLGVGPQQLREAVQSEAAGRLVRFVIV